MNFNSKEKRGLIITGLFATVAIIGGFIYESQVILYTLAIYGWFAFVIASIMYAGVKKIFLGDPNEGAVEIENVDELKQKLIEQLDQFGKTYRIIDLAMDGVIAFVLVNSGFIITGIVYVIHMILLDKSQDIIRNHIEKESGSNE